LILFEIFSPNFVPRSFQFALLLFAALITGCGKKQPVQQQAPPPAQPAEAAAPAPVDGVVDQAMTAQLRAFVQKNGRMPSDFGELRRTSLDSVTRAPRGKKWVIDPATVEVKLVAQ